ncbi:MAG: thrombospondin type 3 repeat-containing protein [Flavobacteriales bacterium]|nr:thrombospondin type 3 repeat-containing protein [Flavobacteriales bacterium]
MQTDKRMAYTWRDDAGGSYPPGRLDFIIFSDAVMTAEKSFTLQTEIMPPARLALYGLSTNSTSNASDHFPVTADFSLAMAVADADGDGVEDALDNCVDTYNPDQMDTDMDGVGDACDLCPTDSNKIEPGICGCNNLDEDTDGDGIFDCVDNCPAVANFDQADWNSDGIGDVCQDFDNDGINDNFEILVWGSDPGNPDTDNDGLSDGDELNIYGTNLLVQDTDGDGLTDSFEVNVSLTSPLDPDTDGDGCNDAMEWGQQCPDSPSASCAGDLDFDGIITTADLLLFLGAFGQSCD